MIKRLFLASILLLSLPLIANARADQPSPPVNLEVYDPCTIVMDNAMYVIDLITDPVDRYRYSVRLSRERSLSGDKYHILVGYKLPHPVAQAMFSTMLTAVSNPGIVIDITGCDTTENAITSFAAIAK